MHLFNADTANVLFIALRETSGHDRSNRHRKCRDEGKNKQWNMPRGRIASGGERGASGVLDPIPQKL